MVKKKYKITGDQTSPDWTQTRLLYIKLQTNSISINTSIPINQALQYSTMIKKIQNSGSIHTSCRSVVQRRRLLQREYLQKENVAKKTLAKQW